MVRPAMDPRPCQAYGFVLVKIDALKFVQGAVSKKDLVPAMAHFVIEGGHVRAFNGVLAISSPIDWQFDCAPLAAPMVKAISYCEDVVSLGLTKTNRLRIESGPFKAFIDCVEMEALPHQMPEGVVMDLDGGSLLNAFKALLPFVGNDASRPWSNGVLLRDNSAFATNNVCLVEYWLGVEFPFTANLPMAAVAEMIRVGQPPTHAQLSENSVTFHYADERWIRTQLYSTEWPDLSKILGVSNNVKPVPENLFEGLEYIKPFVNETSTVYFIDGQLRTHRDDGIGASYQVEGLPDEGVFRLEMLYKLKDAATQIDFGTYPAPMVFYGNQLRGVILGMRE